MRSVDAGVIKRLAALDVSGALSRIHLRFILPLVIGVLTAIVTVAQVIHGLMHDHPVLVWSFFFGLIGASIIVVARKLKRLGGVEVAFMAAGALFSWWLTGLIPASTPETWWFIVLCGALAICAMILPGISGAFILVILGKYEFITATLKNPFDLSNVMVIALFAVGCAGGLAGFSRVLSVLLHRFHDATVAVLAGFMLGALRKVWPWRDVLAVEVVRGKEIVIQEALAAPRGDVMELVLAFGLMLVGFLLVLGLERLAGGPRKS